MIINLFKSVLICIKYSYTNVLCKLSTKIQIFVTELLSRIHNFVTLSYYGAATVIIMDQYIVYNKMYNKIFYFSSWLL